VDLVSTDDVLGADIAVSHLVDRGHKAIAHIAGVTAVARRKGYLQSMREHGFEDQAEIIECDETDAVDTKPQRNYLAGLRGVGLTSVAQPGPELAAAMVAALVDRLDAGSDKRPSVRRWLPPRLVIRTSTGRARATKTRRSEARQNHS
jgi:DNA-binding LacI/PurR family transcriptional regulator